MYQLMNKDVIVGTFELTNPEIIEFGNFKQLGVLPLNFQTITSWLGNRQAAKHRQHIRKLMRECNCEDLLGYIRVLHCTSLQDTFWVKSDAEDIVWNDVSLYTNEFDDIVARLAFEGAGLYGMQFSTTTPEFSIDGSYRKCCVRESGGIYLVKGGTSGFANSGLEPYGEAFSSPIYKHLLGVSTEYSLVRFHGEIATKCLFFTNEFVSLAPYAYFSTDTTVSACLDFYRRSGYEDMFRAMLVADAVCFNSDRHAGNHGVLVDAETQKILCMAPVYDNNLALLPYAMKSDYDAGIDLYLSSLGPRIGNDWITTAKFAMTSDIRSRLINLKGYEIPFEGDDRFPRWRVDALNQLINRQVERILS